MPREDLIGQTIANRFTVRSVLGEGGMATVFLAEQSEEPREVALKVLRTDLTKDKTFAKRFEREARAAARVEHPSSVKILDSGVANGVSYIAMELLRGEDLFAILDRHGRIAPRAAALLLAEVCDALAVAHGLGIVHRDLKPENIMIVRPDGAPSSSAFARGAFEAVLPSGARVKVLDFGIAKLLDPAAIPKPAASRDRVESPSGFTAMTRVGTLIGTPSYMSPEQCAQGPVDARSDIYTCGVLLFQLVTGRLPFEGPSPLHVATLHIHETPPAPSAIVPAIARALEAAILRAIAKKPADRFPSARALAAELRKLAPTLPTDAYTIDEDPTHADDTRISATPVDEETVEALQITNAFGMGAAKTMVSEGHLAGPASVVVRSPARGADLAGEAAVKPPAAPAQRAAAPVAPPPRAPTAEEAAETLDQTVEPEPEDLASTLVRGQVGPEIDPSLAATAQHPVVTVPPRKRADGDAARPVAPMGASRTLPSEASPQEAAPPARPAPAGLVTVGSGAPGISAPGPGGARAPQLGAAPPPQKVSFGVSAVQPVAAQDRTPLPRPATAPTFGLPPQQAAAQDLASDPPRGAITAVPGPRAKESQPIARGRGGDAEAITPASSTSRLVAIGVAIGAGIMAILFGVLYVFVLR